MFVVVDVFIVVCEGCVWMNVFMSMLWCLLIGVCELRLVMMWLFLLVRRFMILWLLLLMFLVSVV